MFIWCYDGWWSMIGEERKKMMNALLQFNLLVLLHRLCSIFSIKGLRRFEFFWVYFLSCLSRFCHWWWHVVCSVVFSSFVVFGLSLFSSYLFCNLRFFRRFQGVSGRHPVSMRFSFCKWHTTSTLVSIGNSRLLSTPQTYSPLTGVVPRLYRWCIDDVSTSGLNFLWRGNTMIYKSCF